VHRQVFIALDPRFISNREYSRVTFDESVIDELEEISSFVFYRGDSYFRSKREKEREQIATN